MALIIKNGTIVTSQKTYVGSIKIINEKIVDISENIKIEKDDEILDVTGKYVLPGAIDLHTHFDLGTGTTSTADDFTTGSKAALAGGTTMFVDFATQEKGKTLKEAVTKWDKKASKGTFCDYGYHMAIIEWNENIKNEMQDMINMGIPSFKMYMAYKGNLQVDDECIYEALVESEKVGGIIGFHCENGDLVSAMGKELIKHGKISPYYHQLSRPNALEEEAISRLGEIAKLTKSPIWVVHLSTKEGYNKIKQIKKSGVNIITETCPQYLVLDNSRYGKEFDNDFSISKYVLSPPLREKKSTELLFEGINNDTIDFISTDHCSFNISQKELGKDDFRKIPNGGPGVEDRLTLMYTYGVLENKFSINDMVKILSESPAKLFGIKNKGTLEVGKDGDIVIFNPDFEDVYSCKTQFQNVDYNAYEGMKRKGKVETVFLRGNKVFSNNTILSKTPSGKFVKREKFVIKNK